MLHFIGAKVVQAIIKYMHRSYLDSHFSRLKIVTINWKEWTYADVKVGILLVMILYRVCGHGPGAFPTLNF